MELDEFKAHWNSIQQKGIKQQKHTTETLERIIMNATNTLGELHEKNVYWNKAGKTVSAMLIGVLLVNLVILYFAPRKFVPSNASTFQASIIYIAILIIYSLVTRWVSNRRVQIFTIDNSNNLKENLKNTIISFKRFYVLFNLIYLVLYPAYFYAFIKLFLFFLTMSTTTVLIACVALTIVSFIVSHIYYKLKYFKKIALLEADLRELESE